MQEPFELLGPRYINHAHNDWLQFVIEGGAAAALLMVAGAAFAIIRIVRMVGEDKEGKATGEAWLGLGLLAVLGVASLVDYPLRVPSIMVLTIIALAMFAQPAISAASRKSGMSSEL